MFAEHREEFLQFLRIEKRLSANSIQAYERDLRLFLSFLKEQGIFDYSALNLVDLESFAFYLSEKKHYAASSQARVMSGVKTFLGFLLRSGYISQSHASNWKAPKIKRKLPVYLEIEEIQKMIDSIDLSRPGGERDKAMLELLYSSGLRVSELIGLKLNDVFLDDHMLKVSGKGNKERLVPVGGAASSQLQRYITLVRAHQPIARAHEGFVFLNLRGKQISRISVFKLVKQTAELGGIDKEVSPHTFRHSFATHMVKNGADLRAVQQMLGHASITTTEIYTHLDREHLKKVIEKFHPGSS